MKEFCGLCAVVGHQNAAQLVRLGLHALQHRGEESAGIIYAEEHYDAHLRQNVRYMHSEKCMGLASGLPNYFPSNKAAIGHVRYSTTGSSCIENIQPTVNSNILDSRNLAIAHNGNITNAEELRLKCNKQLQTTTDTEVVLRLIEQLFEPQHFSSQLGNILMQVEGAYCFLIMSKHQIAAVRDPLGFRPLCLGKLNDAIVIASETCALEVMGAQYIREIGSGEIFVCDLDGHNEQIYTFGDSSKQAQCIFEQIYFSDPASDIFGQNVHCVRKNMGKQLATESPVEADFIDPLPHSGIDAAMGYSEKSNVPYGRAFTTNNYTGRSFIMPQQYSRTQRASTKLHTIKSTVKGKRICLVEDSVVRGTTMQSVVKLLRRAGATEVHLRVASPPIRHPCFFGIDFPSSSELIANKKEIGEIQSFLDLDSLAYLSLEGMLKCVDKPQNYCTACFSGKYPIQVKSAMTKDRLE